MTQPSNNTSSSGGIGFCGLLTIVFITLKLTGYIDWSWWWVWAPMWVPFAAIIVGFIVYLVYKIGYLLVLSISSRRRK